MQNIPAPVLEVLREYLRDAGYSLVHRGLRADKVTPESGNCGVQSTSSSYAAPWGGPASVVTMPHARPNRTPQEWLRTMRSNPLRVIVDREEIRGTQWRRKNVLLSVIETLECGHTNRHFPLDRKEQPARRRRCKACGAAGKVVELPISGTGGA